MTDESSRPASGRPVPACARHPDRPAAADCRGCGRPTCTACLSAGDADARLCPDCAGAAPGPAPVSAPGSAPGAIPGAAYGARYGAFRAPGTSPDASSGTPPGSPSRPVATPAARRRRGPRRPVVTIGFIALCVLMYLAQLGLPRLAGVDLTSALGYAPLHTSPVLLEPWRMLTSAVLHSPSSVMHIAFNMMALWVVGRTIEPAVGAGRYLSLLLLSAFGASVAVLLLSAPGTLTVGASGAVFGLFGALFVLLRSTGAQTGGIIALVGINMAVSFLVPGISWQGHLGGLVAGLLTALIIARAPRGPRGAPRDLWQIIGLIGLAALLVLLTVVGRTLVGIPGM